jgi:hypothetical protein
VSDIHHDNGAARGNRTRLFRDTRGGVEWIFHVDYAGGCRRWYAFGLDPENSIAKMKSDGMPLTPLAPSIGYRTEMTTAGEQMVIPGCERDDSRTGARQMMLF